MTGKKVLIAVSGGVDSSISAKRLKDAGAELLAVYMKLHDDEASHEENIRKASQICEYLHIPFEVLDLKELFFKKIIQSFAKSYISGETPNPCTVCNRLIKFGELAKYAEAKGCEYIATGHYAKTDGKFIYEADDKAKDQSYFLFNLDAAVVPKIIFPLGGSFKSDIKEEAAKIPAFAKLSTQKESSEICFAPGNYTDVLKRFAAVDIKGEVLSEKGEIIGTHNGYMHYTIGKRRGFDAPLSEEPLYVKHIDAEKNRLIVAPKPELDGDYLELVQLNFFEPMPEQFKTQIKVRYRSEKVDCSVEWDGVTAKVKLHKPQFAIAAGQAAVFYDDERVVGGGFVKKFD